MNPRNPMTFGIWQVSMCCQYSALTCNHMFNMYRNRKSIESVRAIESIHLSVSAFVWSFSGYSQFTLFALSLFDSLFFSSSSTVLCAMLNRSLSTRFVLCVRARCFVSRCFVCRCTARSMCCGQWYDACIKSYGTFTNV